MDVGFEQNRPEEKLTLEGCLLGGLVILACELFVGLLGLAVVVAILYAVVSLFLQ